MSTNKILSSTLIALLLGLFAQAQEITVTVAEKHPVTIESLDFETFLDEVSMKKLKEKGVEVDVYSTQTSPQGTSYACLLQGVTKKVFDGLEDRWKIQLSSAKTSNSKLKNQDNFMAEVYKALLVEGRSKAHPIALSMQKELDSVEGIKLLKYHTVENPSSENPYTREVFAKIEVDYNCKDR